MTQPEARLSARISNAIRVNFGERVFIFKAWGNSVQMAGLPDLIGCLDGKFFGIEVKMPAKRNNVSPIQDHVMSTIAGAGGHVTVCCGVDEALNFLTEFAKSS